MAIRSTHSDEVNDAHANDHVYWQGIPFAPPLLVTAGEIDWFARVARESIHAVVARFGRHRG